MNYPHVLTLITFLPLVGVLVLLFCRRDSNRSAKTTAFFFSLAPLLLVFGVWRNFDTGSAALQYVDKHDWIPSLGVFYHVGVDGLSMAMVILVAIVTPLAMIASFKWTNLNPTRGGMRTFYILMLLEQSGLFGAFTALNFFHWFIFWEASLVPIFFLIKLYGNENRNPAAFQFFLYTFVGSVAMVIGMQFIYLATGSWDFIELAQKARTVTPESGGDTILVSNIKALAATTKVPFIINHSVTLLFILVFMGFAVKVPLFPFHTWLPATYTQASSPVSMILTGLMSKMGVYGFLRIVLPLFGGTMSQHFNTLMILAVITVFWGAWSAFAQRDFKTLIAYSSISHLGYCLFGIFAIASTADGTENRAMALNGVLVQMFAHGLSAAGLFFYAGILEQRFHTRDMLALGGLRKQVPIMCGLMGITVFASLGLPSLAGFVGEYMIFQGAVSLSFLYTSIATFGIVLTALYLLKLLSRVYFGPTEEKLNGTPDLSNREMILAIVFVALLFGVGLYPSPIIDLSNKTVVEMANFFAKL